jgi:hypothetical protein
MKITITMEIDGDYADPSHKMGVTEEGFDAILEALSELGTDIEVKQAP